MKRIVVGLSGGVDSSVAAWLLAQQGWEVIGVFMRNWHDESVTINNECPWIDDSNDAMIAAEFLGIPFHVLDMSKEYKARIVDYMFREYEAGRTPNPDVLCNREVKFDLFLKAALELKADAIGTGHYCRVENMNVKGKKIYRLLKGVDDTKDQSYFLCQIDQYQLSKAVFPIGHLLKSEVRNIAREIGLPNSEKKDSQGLCFIGKVKLPVFLQQQLLPREGKIVEVPLTSPNFDIPESNATDTDEELEVLTSPYVFDEEMGRVIGLHQGIHYYTIGQRKGLHVGGFKEPLFIVETDPIKNIVYTGQGELHPALFRKGLFIQSSEIHWIREDLNMAVNEIRQYHVRIRYRQHPGKCTLHMKRKGLYLIFDEAQRGVARGQFAAWYDGDELIGSGVIS